MSAEATNDTHFDEVVIGVDGHDGGRDAVALAVALGARRLTLVGAYAHDPRTGAGDEHYRQLLHDDMVRALEATKVRLGILADIVAIGDPSPARALHEVAQDRGAELIVVGSAHRGPVGRVLLGDVSRGVLHGSPCPVAVAPHRYHRRPGRLATVAIGYDGSPEAREALRLGHRLASAHGAVIAVHVVWEGPTIVIAAMAYSEEITRLAAEDRERAGRVLDEARDVLPAAARGELHEGSPHAQLTEVTEHADVLVLGSRAWGPVHRIAVGSTADRVLHHAACPVIVVPRGATVAGPRDADAVTTVSAG